MRILAIDPGQSWGSAYYEDGGEIYLDHGKMKGRSPDDKKRRLAADLSAWYPIAWDLLVVERPVPPGPGRSLLGTISLAMTAGVWVGAIPCEELRIVTPSEWNSRGTGLARATRYATKHKVEFKSDDEKSALGILLWALKETGEEAE